MIGMKLTTSINVVKNTPPNLFHSMALGGR